MVKVIHFYDNNTKIEKKIVEKIGFLLTNKKGGYCYFSDKPVSRYQGFFIAHNWKLYKVIEDIKLIKEKSIKEIWNNFWNVERKRDNVLETFFLPDNHNSLVYEFDDINEIELTLDVKESYDNREWGRNYDIQKEGDLIIITFTKKTDEKEDNSHDKPEYQLYIVIKSDIPDCKIIGKWTKRDYKLDKERNSRPYGRFVYKAIKLKAKKIIISASINKEDAIKESSYVFENLEKLKIKENLELRNKVIINKSNNINRKIAFICAQYALNNLVNNIDSTKGIFAGLPWFFQFWSRDELISLKGLMITKQYSLVKEILIRYINAINEQGRLPNIFSSDYPNSPLGSTDSIGWLFKRLYDFLEILRTENITEKYFSEKELEDIKNKLKHSLDRINENFVKQGLYYNKVLETWMDTQAENDTRDGFRIETQALFINMYRVMYYLTQDFSYKKKENELKELVRQKFWNKKILADGDNDFTIRPNIFIAAYIYQDFLTIDEWKVCFKNALKSLWLSWGGLSTIDKKHHLFCSTNTGEDNKSYHRGDSWFWINNLTALVLNRIDKKSFKRYINKIIDASIKEILFKGIIGANGELSSAKSLKSQASLSQAWSNALFIELINEV